MLTVISNDKVLKFNNWAEAFDDVDYWENATVINDVKNTVHVYDSNGELLHIHGVVKE